MRRGQEIGWDRVINGSHYPSDVLAGRVLGAAVARAMAKNDAFRSRFAEAKAEYQAFVAGGAVPEPELTTAHH